MPAARAVWIAWNTASQAEVEIAWLMPDTCRMRAAPMAASGTSAGVKRAAAELSR